MANKINRRDFLALMGAGGAAAATISCGSKPNYDETWHPWLEPVDGTIPYVPRYYATSTREAEGGSYHVKVVDGRVIKVDGSPDHPLTQGTVTARQQSIVQDLYGADRVRKPMDKEGNTLTWRQLHARLDEKLAEHKGANVSALTGLTTGAVNDVWTRFVAWAGNGSLVHYEPFCQSDFVTASEKVFGRAELPLVSLAGSDYVCSLGAQFLETWGNVNANSLHYAAMRKVDHGKRGKHVQFEAKMTGTGASADQVHFSKPGSETLIALALLKAVAEKKGNGALAAMAGDTTLAMAAEAAQLKLADLEHLADELAAAKSPVVLPAEGISQGEHGVAHHAAVLLLNSALGSIGTHYNYDRAKPIAHVASHQGIDQLIDDMNAGNVKVLILKDVNPVYALPPEKKFAEALAKVDFVVAFAASTNETTALAHVVVPVTHDLEAWGEINTYRGMDMLQQAVMRPRWNCKQAEDLLLEKMTADGETATPFRDVLKQSFMTKMGAAGDAAWREFLKKGGKFEPIEAGANVPVAGGMSASMFDAAKTAVVDGLALVIHESSRHGDGRYANRGWMQELPDQMTSVAWDSWLEMSPARASEMGVRNGDLIKVDAGGQSVDVPAFIIETVSDHAVALATGQGHTGLDQLYNRGVNTFVFFSGALSDGNQYNTKPMSVSLSKAGGHRKMATPHVPGTGDRINTPLTGMEPDHHSNRQIFQAIGISELKDHGDDHGGDHGGHGGHADKYRYMAAKDGKKIEFPVHTDKDFYPDRSDTPVVAGREATFYDEYKWEMAVDLNTCTGCGSCSVACSAENNIPVVGRDEVIKGREMAWIRINRYLEFAKFDHHGKVADYDKPKVRYVPMMCQQCGNAPCESVCPSLATYHNPEGLNAMVYNRCVGTRYCSNNCSYKVRRFNWYTWDFPGDLNWQLNPAVSQRHKGVMEKCTFCVQRIRDAKDTARDEGRKVQDGDFMTACQQACPSQAISFGNAQDKESTVAVHSHDARAYKALDAHLHTLPGVSYLKRVDLDTHDSEAQHG